MGGAEPNETQHYQKIIIQLAYATEKLKPYIW